MFFFSPPPCGIRWTSGNAPALGAASGTPQQGEEVWQSRCSSMRCGIPSNRRAPRAYAVTANAVRYFDGNGTDRLSIDELADTPALVAVSSSGSISDMVELAETDYLLYR